MRTFSDSTTTPEEDNKKDIFSDVDSEIEYQLQIVKPKLHQPGSPSEGVAVMELVAIARRGNEDDVSGENVESSVTMFVNNGYMDVKESNQSTKRLNPKEQKSLDCCKNEVNTMLYPYSYM